MRFIFVLLFFMTYSGHCIAQVIFEAAFGLTSSNLAYENSILSMEYDPVHHFHIDGTISARVHRNLRLSMTNQVDTRGHKTRENNALTYRGVFLDLIPIAWVGFGKYLEVGVGGYYSHLFSYKYKGVNDQYIEIKHLELLTNSDYGSVFSALLYYRRFGIRLLYKYGIRNIDNVKVHNVNGRSIGEVSHKSRAFQISLQYRIIE